MAPGTCWVKGPWTVSVSHVRSSLMCNECITGRWSPTTNLDDFSARRYINEADCTFSNLAKTKKSNIQKHLPIQFHILHPSRLVFLAPEHVDRGNVHSSLVAIEVMSLRCQNTIAASETFNDQDLLQPWDELAWGDLVDLTLPSIFPGS